MNDIRRALDDLVGQPPANLGRRGAVMRRIERTQARRRLAVQAALSAFLVTSVAFGASRVISATPTGNDSLVQQPSPSGGGEQQKDEPATPAPEKPAKKKAKGAPPVEKTAAPKPTDKPAYEPKPSYEPKPTYSEQPKPPAKPSYSKEPVADGLAAELWPYTDAVAGSPMEWKVKAYDDAGRLLRIEVRFGDGKTSVYEPDEGCGDGVAVKKFFSHTYAKAGSYTGTAIVTTGGCGAPTETKTVYGSVKVVEAEQGNGPAKPTVTAEWSDGKLLVHGADADGFVKKFWVDWGDGSPETYLGPRSLDACEPGQGSQWDTSAGHTFPEAGTYTVTVTVMSTNCEGGQGQTATTTLTVTV